MTLNAQDVVLRFMASLGRRDEAQYYLELFRGAPERFAVIRVDPQLSELGLEALALDLHYLAGLELYPVVAAAAPIPNAEELGLEAEIHIAGTTPELAALAAARRTRKVVLLGPAAGIGPSLVDVTTEYDSLMATLTPEHAALLTEARDLLAAVTHSMNVSITSPLQLLRELFTEKGAGTLVRRGARIQRFEGYDGVDLNEVHHVILSAFGSAPVASFFDRPVERVYVAGGYHGVAIVEATPLAPYLTKFAVDQRARGEGIGRDLWRALVADYPRLFWRCRPDNPVAAWYQAQCHGMVRADDWFVFWRGLQPDEIAPAIAAALAAPRDIATSSERPPPRP